MFSEDQTYRGIGAVISYEGHVLCRERGVSAFKGAKWAVYDLHGRWIGASRDFKGAKQIVDRRNVEANEVERVITREGAPIRLCEYPDDEYVNWCKHCELGNDDHAAADHPFERKPDEKPTRCLRCHATVDPDRHFGVYFTTVSYAVYCSRECAYHHEEALEEARVSA